MTQSPNPQPQPPPAPAQPPVAVPFQPYVAPKKSGGPWVLVIVLVAVVAGISLLALLVSILVPTLGRARELAKQAICGANLNAIGKGVALYVTEPSNLDRFPLRVTSGDVKSPLGRSTAAGDVYDPALGPHAMQNPWVMIRAGTISRQVFQCPSDQDWVDHKSGTPVALPRYGWTDRRQFSYTMHKPYGAQVEVEDEKQADKRARLSTPRPGAFVIFADKNVGGRIYYNGRKDKNPPANHPADGFNILSYQGTVRFHKTPVNKPSANSKAGVGNDDIYCAGNNQGANAYDEPTSTNDSFILPWE